MATLQDFHLDGIAGGKDLVPTLKGKVVLAVNVASKCGLTPQYQALEQLYESHKDDGLVILGLPCNQFGAQEPGTEAEIVKFCQTSYDVTFPLTKKIEVNGPARHPIYQWFTAKENFPGDIEWNFEKFLIDRKGRVIKRYPPATKPDDKGLLADIAEIL
jgi:glutathione peroxidase